MRAVQLLSWQAEPELREVPVPVAGPGEALVAVQATGLCHSDLHVMDWPAGTLDWELPVTLGHETAGTVAALGAGARDVEEGEPVLVYGPWGCGRCRQCAMGAENICARRSGCGLGRDGGLADFVVVPSTRLLVPRGDFVGSDETVRLGAAVIESGGHVAIVGSGGSTFPFAINSVPLEWSAGRPSWGTLPELHEVVALARAGRIEIDVEQLALDQAVEGYRRLRRGEVSGRAVVTP